MEPVTPVVMSSVVMSAIGVDSTLETPATSFGITAPRGTTLHSTVVAQQFDQDILGDLGTMVGNFIESGQIWALIIGFVLGYLFRSMTTYQ